MSEERTLSEAIPFWDDWLCGCDGETWCKQHQPDPKEASMTETIIAVTDDEALHIALTTIAEAAKRTITFHGKNTMPSRDEWNAAVIVLVGTDLAEKVAAQKFPPRDRIMLTLVTNDMPEAPVWQQAVTLFAEHVIALPDGAGWLHDRFADTDPLEDSKTDKIKVKIGWSEEAQYTSHITVDPAKVREWVVENAEPGWKTAASLVEITDDIVLKYLADVDESVWFEQCDTVKDFGFVKGRDIDYAQQEVTE